MRTVAIALVSALGLAYAGGTAHTDRLEASEPAAPPFSVVEATIPEMRAAMSRGA